MNASRLEKAIPNWFRLACCSVPLISLLIASTGMAVGASINPFVFGALSALTWRVLTLVLGVKAPALVVQLPTNARKIQNVD